MERQPFGPAIPSALRTLRPCVASPRCSALRTSVLTVASEQLAHTWALNDDTAPHATQMRLI